MPEPIVQLLLNAAELAERRPTVAKAIATGWSALHNEVPGNEWPGRPITMAAFEAWALSEDVSHWRQYLTDVLRRRYNSPGEVAGSLRRAAYFDGEVA